MANNRKSDGMKRMMGSFQPCRERKVLSGMEGSGGVAAPAGLSGKAKKIFSEKAEILRRNGLLSELDREELAVYATSMAIVYECIAGMKKGGVVIKKMDKAGDVVEVSVNPYNRLYDQHVRIVTQIGLKFGFNPGSRSVVAKGAEVKEEVDPIMELLKIV